MLREMMSNDVRNAADGEKAVRAPRSVQSSHFVSVLKEGAHAVIASGPLRGFAGVVERRTSKTHVYLRIDSRLGMRVEIADAQLRQTDNA